MSRSRSTIIIVGLISLVLVGVWVFIFFAVRTSSAKLVALETTHLGQQSQEDNQFIIKRQLDNTQQERIKLAAYFVDEQGIVAFLEQIETLGKSIGVKVEVSSADARDKLLISLAAIGSFKSLLHFVQLLETLPYQLTITGLSLNGPGTTEASGWSGDIKIELDTVLKP